MRNLSLSAILSLSISLSYCPSPPQHKSFEKALFLPFPIRTQKLSSGGDTPSQPLPSSLSPFLSFSSSSSSSQLEIPPVHCLPFETEQSNGDRDSRIEGTVDRLLPLEQQQI
uniref:Uncharacterized protein n=1 Tax=Nelumbo nucifera TaxID=4432 RepID=A0A822Y9B8_NELNU|nr:TPA_asm: hypothetical protein HUJ06_029234 [Nelumbo nucifera]